MPDSEDEDGSLSKEPTGEDAKKLLEDVSDKTEQVANDDMVEAIQSTTDVMARVNADVQASTYQSPAMQVTLSDPVSDDKISIESSDPDSDDKLNSLMGKVQELLDRSSNQTEKKTWSVKTWLAVLGLGMVGAAGLIYELIARFAKKEDTSDIDQVSDDDKKKIEDLVDQWQDEDASTYWKSLRNYAESASPSPTVADLVFFMQYTATLFPLDAPFTWDSSADQAAVVDKLTSDAAARGNSPNSILEDLVDGLTYKDAPLPRLVAANCAELALVALPR